MSVQRNKKCYDGKETIWKLKKYIFIQKKNSGHICIQPARKFSIICL